MNREQKKKLSRAKRIAQNAKKARQLQELEEDDVPDMDDSVEEEDDMKSLEKDYYGNEEVQQGGFVPKSFSELDIAIDAKIKAQKVNDTSWMVQDLVRNIINYPDFSPEEKSSAIKSVADEFSSRVRTIMESPLQKEAEENIDALVLDATLARDKRNMSIVEGIRDMFSKAVLTSSAEDKLPDESFAFVVEKDEKKIRKYPIHTKAHIRQSMSNISKDIKNGDKDAEVALPKVKEAAKKSGIDVTMENNANAIQVEKDLNGDWRAVMWVSNNFIDWDGDIISEDAHKEYVDWVNQNKECMPAFVTWHTPGTSRSASVDYMDYIDGFLIASSKLTESEAVSLLKAKKQTNIGMSHGSFVLERDSEDRRIINKYRMYEVSDLPLDKAANPFTDFETVSKEVDMDKKEYLATIIGEEKAEAFLAKTGLKQKALQEAEIESKETTEEVVEPVVEPAVEPVAETKDFSEAIEQFKKDLDIDGLNAFVMEAKDAMEKVHVLEELVKELANKNLELAKAKDEELAEMISPPVARMAWSRPSKSEENIIEKDDKLTDTVAVLDKTYWLSNLTGTTPIKETA